MLVYYEWGEVQEGKSKVRMEKGGLRMDDCCNGKLRRSDIILGKKGVILIVEKYRSLFYLN